ncbi:DUF5776 domain-containing protein [Lentilactobacillus kefiri]|uniref:Bacterial group 3 Ig-like protein n=1 Tax=Lentilactobacillus kefiri DSM 20587 = JCM 5818 TaxID=1423764 RepID=A0A8E1RJW2_LENKE|nr:DUF5776 domain-containing protein [Lentilactobacillus kefiri]KRL72735.1 bacterial group 3 Ig-like protein [Lentilactobacillus parakefiri DSM 10551]KRM52722.1 bacterial group 3 Ig-like protein [Lentilactobacillus kefiri DSM 20587 = JCM 5818]MDM7494089.1 DUF5776 domain-containing protein [Lentilactobacillus kefiri]
MATFVLVGILSGQTASVSADTPQLQGSISFTATNKQGNKQTIGESKASDGATYANPAQVYYNTQKYSDLIENYTLTNNTGVTANVESILNLPQITNTVPPTDPKYDPLTLIYDSSRQSDLQINVPSTFDKGYSYANSHYTKTFSNTSPLLALYAGKLSNAGITSWQFLTSGNSIQMQVPLIPNPNYDYSNPKSGYTRDTVPINGNNVAYNTHLNVRITAFKSIILNQESLSAATYNDLLNAAKSNIKKLFKDNATEEADHSKATIVVEPTNTPGSWDVTYTYDGVTIKIPGTTTELSSMSTKDFSVSYGSNWNSQKFNGITILKDANGNGVTPSNTNVTTTIKNSDGNTVNAVNTSDAGAVYYISYTYKGITQTVKVTVGQRGVTPNTPTSPTTPVTPTNPTNPNWNPSKPNGLNGTGLPNYAATKGSAVYSTKGIYMYKNANFKKSQRMAYYPISKRVNRHMFVVLGYARSNGGALRYKVRDVNHGTKTDGKIGYITANKKYVESVYYKTLPKNRKITVISKRGIHSYKHVNLTGRTGTYKTGKHLRVKKIVKHNLTTRYQLTNGDYITANKKLVIKGNY